ncbi:methyltransferase [Thalassotalea crassostreae]|uniref:methyltransferase n=1 Tax=Thalassotalea crassostreae TaxID=1763536 RepID=UPI000837DE6B|nr:methyltransferase [Thalassotalea crassostreae]
MSLSNPTQLLLRNADLLKADAPLVVNCPDSGLISELVAINAHQNISCYNVNYAEHQALSKKFSALDCQFSAHYQSTQLHDLVIIYFPKSKKEFNFLLAMLTPIISDNGIILVVGENKGGVKSAAKLSKEHVVRCDKVDSARHCLLVEAIFNNQRREFNLDSWFEQFSVEIAATTITVASLPGVFSNGELDKGTRLLLENLPKSINGKVLDFGCGAGVIGSYVKKRYQGTNIEMLDVNALAIASAKRTLTLNGLEGKVFASDSLSNVSGQYNTVISNPPFHQGIKTNYHATESFLKGIKGHIAKNGSLTIVANNFLRYAPIIKAEIAEPQLLINSQGFAIHHCQKQ